MRAARRVGVVAAAAALLTAGCGNPTPQAPKTAVQDALNALGLRCGEATMVVAGHGSRADLERLDRQARKPAATLASIARKHPDAIYLTSKLSHVVSSEVTTLESCRLSGAAQRLRAAL